MAYEPYTWKQSEVITSERLNHIESGVSELDTAAVHKHESEEIDGDKKFTGETTFLNGKNGLRVTGDGIQRTSDGGTTWVNI